MLKKLQIPTMGPIILAITFLCLISSQALAETRLLYPQEQKIKPMGRRLSKLIGKFKTYKALYDQGKYTLKPELGLGILEDLKKLEDDFNKANFPADNKKVKNFKTWLVSLKKNTPKLEQLYTEAYNEAAKKEAANPTIKSVNDIPDYKQDVERLKAMYKNYKNPASVFRNPEKAKILVPKFQNEYAFFNNLPEKYEALLKINKAGSIPTWIRTNQKYLEKFEKYQSDYAAQLPQKLTAMIDGALKMAEKAKADNKPAFFKGGVKQQVNSADALLSIYVVIKGENDPAVLELDKKFTTVKKKINDIEIAMAEELLGSVRAPEDMYSGSDKNKLKKMIEQEWKKLYPNDKILAVRLNSADWKRTTDWKWNNSGWYKVDTSVLPARVILKTDNNIATIYPAFINKDHLKNNRLNVGAHTKKSGYVIQNMLLKNFR
jgi:hypothetical protein